MPGMTGRILMTTDAVGGVWTYGLELARGLARADVETTLAVLGPAPSRAQWNDARNVPGLTVIQTGFPLDWSAGVDVTRIEQSAAGLAELASEIRADVVHLNSPIFASGARFPVPVVGVCHSCLATWWHAVRGDAPLPHEFAWRGELVRLGYQRCDALVAPSEAFASATAEVHRLPAKPIVVHNGHDPHVQPPPPDSTSIFTAGRLWDEGKNARALDQAAALLNAPIFAAGPLSGPDGQFIPFDHLRPLGKRSDDQIAERLAARPIFVSVSRYEPFGLAVLEAASAGCALVLSDIPTFRELWRDAASFVPAGDSTAIAAALQDLLEQPDRRRQQGVQAAKRAAVYSTARMTGRMLAIYTNLTGESRFARQVAA
jgi:glycosyltransferase involved in cell wall biosynthesis